jgi:hypothetical protein
MLTQRQIRSEIKYANKLGARMQAIMNNKSGKGTSCTSQGTKSGGKKPKGY